MRIWQRRYCWGPNERLEPTALSWRLAGEVGPVTVVFGGVVLPVSGGGSRAGR